MRKKVVALMLAMSMTFAFCACGASEDSSSEAAQEDFASDMEDAVEESSTEDTEEEIAEEEAVSESADEETEENEEESEEANEYGFTELQQEALVESVKNAVTTDFLEPYNISPSEFELQPYDVNDLFNYDSDGNYTGDDPYGTSDIWSSIDRAIFIHCDIAWMIETWLFVGEETETMVDGIENALESGSITITSTLEDNAVSLTGSEERIALGSAVYRGIAEFLNNLDTRECAELLVTLGLRYLNSETVDGSESGDSSSTTSYSTTTVFDKVITENIQFE